MRAILLSQFEEQTRVHQQRLQKRIPQLFSLFHLKTSAWAKLSTRETHIQRKPFQEGPPEGSRAPAQRDQNHRMPACRTAHSQAHLVLFRQGEGAEVASLASLPAHFEPHSAWLRGTRSCISGDWRDGPTGGLASHRRFPLCPQIQKQQQFVPVPQSMWAGAESGTWGELSIDRAWEDGTSLLSPAD